MKKWVAFAEWHEALYWYAVEAETAEEAAADVARKYGQDWFYLVEAAGPVEKFEMKQKPGPWEVASREPGQPD
jgi:hypothetical protein